ncbi:MAG TPA: C4-dicarboxylate ABC transporter, partial [Burkholderiales bacterium]|nr:C4-dicarboxylate ABC transporter [Burkholderiales bacterium]
MKRYLAAVIALALAGIVHAQPASRTLKMQASWPSTVTAWDNFRFIADRLDKTTAGAIKIETLTAGQIVPAFEVLDATHKKVLDGAHTIAYYWVGKHKAAVLFTGGPGGPYGMDMIDFLGWMYEGGGWELYREFYQDVLKLNVIAFPALPTSPQAFGWFKRP